MSNVITVSGLTKTYKLYDSKSARAADLFIPFGKRRYHPYYALRDINFNIERGESLGVIGRNGSGKSTLLKILTGVLSQTSGSVHVEGRIASLLELGAGFNPELTGRENIYFNGALLGYTKSQMENRVAEIISFADIGEFIDQPVKVYSSGMFVRLAFSVSVHVDPDVLIVDEALAVGDVRFQKKCIDFMRRFRDAGKTIVFVSHDIFTVKSFCDRLILIDRGNLEAIGDPDEVANRYYQIMFPSDSERNPVEITDQTLQFAAVEDNAYFLEIDPKESTSHWGHGAAWISNLRIGGLRSPNLFDWDSAIEIECVVRWNAAEVSQLCGEYGIQPKMLVGFRLETAQGVVLTNFASSTLDPGAFDVNLDRNSECVLRCRIEPMRLAAGHYFITPAVAIGTQDHLHPVKEYTNLIHLLCDTKQIVLGQTRMDYSIDVLDLA